MAASRSARDPAPGRKNESRSGRWRVEEGRRTASLTNWKPGLVRGFSTISSRKAVDGSSAAASAGGYHLTTRALQDGTSGAPVRARARSDIRASRTRLAP